MANRPSERTSSASMQASLLKAMTAQFRVFAVLLPLPLALAEEAQAWIWRGIRPSVPACFVYAVHEVCDLRVNPNAPEGLELALHTVCAVSALFQ